MTREDDIEQQRACGMLTKREADRLLKGLAPNDGEASSEEADAVLGDED